jgi:hypothetical protein
MYYLSNPASIVTFLESTNAGPRLFHHFVTMNLISDSMLCQNVTVNWTIYWKEHLYIRYKLICKKMWYRCIRPVAIARIYQINQFLLWIFLCTQTNYLLFIRQNFWAFMIAKSFLLNLSVGRTQPILALVCIKIDLMQLWNIRMRRLDLMRNLNSYLRDW